MIYIIINQRNKRIRIKGKNMHNNTINAESLETVRERERERELHFNEIDNGIDIIYRIEKDSNKSLERLGFYCCLFVLWKDFIFK